MRIDGDIAELLEMLRFGRAGAKFIETFPTPED
jgi:hypothetical protein